MATVTLTPDAYYHVSSNGMTVTAVNPTNKRVKWTDSGSTTQYVFVHFTIPNDAAWAYSTITGQTLTLNDTYVTAVGCWGGVSYAYGSLKNVSSLAVGDQAIPGNENLLGWINYANNDVNTRSNKTVSLSEVYIRNLNAGNLWLMFDMSVTTTDKRDRDYIFSSITLKLTYTAVTTPVFNIAPSSGFLRYDLANTFTLNNANTESMINRFTADGGTLYYKLSSASNYSSVVFTGSTVTLPANTLQNGENYDIYADVNTTAGYTGTTSTGTYTTVDTIGTTTGQTPNNSIEYGDVTFTWTYRNSTGTAQYAYDLDISDDGTTYTTVLSHVVTSATTATYNVSTAGGKYWRVRGYNQNDVAGNYSTPLYFVNNIPPSPPVITNISGTGRLTVTWQADSQSAYEVEVYEGDTRVYDSTVVYTADTTHLINEYLPNGTYTIKVKIINIYGHTSDYSTTVYSIANVGSINVTGSYENGTATLTYAGNYVLYYIQRDGVTIAKTTATTYNDLYMNGTAQYTVIGVNSDDSYAIGTATVTGTVPFTRFVDLDGNVYDISKRWLQRIGVQVSNEAEYDTALYLGAKRPAHTFGTGRIRRYAIAFTYEGDYTVFMGKVLRYMDIYGNADYVVVPNINEVEARYGNELTASLEVTDYDEGITYDL